MVAWDVVVLGSAEAEEERESDTGAMVPATGTSLGEEVGEGVWEMERE